MVNRWHTRVDNAPDGRSGIELFVKSYGRRALFQYSSLKKGTPVINETEMKHLGRCIELATLAVDSGNPPFGSVLVDGNGAVRFEDHNHTAGGDSTQHPEFAIARWAAANMTPDERAGSTVYTSGEHCPMCAAAHGWVGLGRIVYASSSEQLSAWLDEMHAEPPPVATLPINQVVPGVPVEGPFPVLSDAVRDLHLRFQAGPNADGRV